MKLSELSVRRGVAVSMIYLVVLGFGLFSLGRLQVDLYPELNFPMVMVVTTYTGASPEDVEKLISRPLEGGLATVEGVERLRSTSSSGTSLVTVEFDWGRDMDQAETDVRRAIDLVEARLPEDASAPLVFALDPSMQPILRLMLRGPLSPAALRRLAEDDLAPLLERVEGVANVEVAGGLDREIQVLLEPERVSAFGLDLDAVRGALYAENRQEPGGTIEQGARRYEIHTQGQYRSVAELGQVVVGQRAGAAGPEPILLEQVARVVDGFAERTRTLEADGAAAVMLNVRKQTGSNTVAVSAGVGDALRGIQGTLGEGVEVVVVSDQATQVNASVSNLSTTAMLAVGITFLVLLLFLRQVRSSLVVASAIPVSVIATFALMDQAGMTLNMISMAGLALAIGMLVDNAIVVLENIVRLRDEGLPLRDAALQGAAQVGTAVTASTLTTISVFVPILFVPGVAGVMFRDMAITICFALAVSLTVALTFVPLAASRLLGGRGARGAAATPRESNADPVLERLQRAYGRRLDWVLGHRWVVVLGLGLVLGLTALLALRVPTDFLARPDRSEVTLELETEPGISLEELGQVARRAADRLREVVPAAERKMVALDAGAGEGLAAAFGGGSNRATLLVPLVGMKERGRSQARIEQALREDLGRLPGLRVSIKSPGPTGAAGDIEVELRGHDLSQARRSGRELQRRLEALPYMAEVQFSLADQVPELSVTFDRAKLAELGLSAAAVGRTVSTAFKGRVAGAYSEDGDESDILVRYERARRDEVAELGALPLRTPSGLTVPLASVARIEERPGPSAITRVDQERVTTLTCTLADTWRDASGQIRRKDLGASIEALRTELADFSWPAGFRNEIGGTAQDFQESFAALGIALLVAVLLVYMVMAAQFESFRQPFIILFTVPLAGIGVVAMLGATASAADVGALIGVVMLVGIVVNNGIVMVDAANTLQAQGLERRAAASAAARLRLRPVLLTSLTTILSMVPLALELGDGAEIWSGMAKAVIGGLLAATLLTLVVVPTMYTVFAPKEVQA